MSLIQAPRIVGCLSLRVARLLLLSSPCAAARDAGNALTTKANAAIAGANLQCTAIDAREIMQPDTGGAPAAAHGDVNISGSFADNPAGPGVGVPPDDDAGSPAAVAPAQISAPLAYEVACAQGLGYVIVNQPSASPHAVYSCLEMAVPPQKNLACTLAANEDQSAGFNNLIAKAGVNCALAGATRIGAQRTEFLLRSRVQGR